MYTGLHVSIHSCIQVIHSHWHQFVHAYIVISRSTFVQTSLQGSPCPRRLDVLACPVADGLLGCVLCVRVREVVLQQLDHKAALRTAAPRGLAMAGWDGMQWHGFGG